MDFLIDISSVDPGDAGDDQKREASLARVGRLVNAWKTDGDAYSIEKSQRWSRRLLNEPASKEKGEDFADKALKKFLNSTTDDAALRRPGLIKQTITLTSR